MNWCWINFYLLLEIFFNVIYPIINIFIRKEFLCLSKKINNSFLLHYVWCVLPMEMSCKDKGSMFLVNVGLLTWQVNILLWETLKSQKNLIFFWKYWREKNKEKEKSFNYLTWKIELLGLLEFQALIALIVWHKFSDTISRLLLFLFQGDDMHRTKAFSQSTGAFTQCVLSLYI